jgi:hypothetical protein
MKTLSTLFKLLVFVVLFLLPFGGRWFWHYRGKYETPNIAPIDSTRISASAENYNSYVDQPKPGNGRVVIDLTHENNLLVDDLTPLKSRLAVRGVEVEIFDSTSSDTMAARLRGTTALIELVPTYSFEPEERQVIIDFINDGGRLLLAADPTRPVPVYQESGSVDLYSVFFPESAIPAVNSLATAFGVSYFEDYVYNLAEYDANYRNVKYSTFAKDSSLTEGLDQVTLFAAHSLRGDGLPLIVGDENTLSNVRAGETGFVPAILAEDGKVLALGDITFMTSPYYQVADNGHLLSNIADWLAMDTRQWDLKDFPFLFDDPVDLIQTFSDAVDPRLIAQSTPLQELFSQSDIPLQLSTEVDLEHDALYVGTFSELDKLQDFLTAADITITFSSTQTTTVLTDTNDIENIGDTESGEGEETLKDTITVKDFGVFIARGSSLYLVNRNGDQLSMIVLAEDEEATLLAMERLLMADFDGCVSQQDVTVCSTGETPIPEEPAQEEPPIQEGEEETGNEEPVQLKSVLIISVDNGLSGKRNSASELEMALSGVYDVTIWSIKNQGVPIDSDLEGYDAYIVDTGDYIYDDEVAKVLEGVSDIDPVLLIGEQPFSVDGEFFKAAPIADLVVTDAEHPLAFMFTEGETVVLSESESGTPALILPKDLFITTDTGTVVFERGSSSEEAGSPAVYASDENADQRFVVATFAFYRLPVDKQFNFILNVVEWLTAE